MKGNECEGFVTLLNVRLGLACLGLNMLGRVMTIAQFIVAYAVCWWLVLFMLLPVAATPAPAPEKGHAPSAPANPHIRKKFRWATLLAFLPTLLIYFVATNVKAEDTIYHVGGGCNRLKSYKAPADLSARDGYGVGEKKVKSADVAGKSTFIDTDAIRIPLEIPAQNYIDRGGVGAASPTSIHGRNVDLSHSFINAGELATKLDGDISLNGQSITQSQVFEEGCVDEK